MSTYIIIDIYYGYNIGRIKGKVTHTFLCGNNANVKYKGMIGILIAFLL